MHYRFYAPALGPGDERIELPPDESAHAVRVMRVRPGAMVRVFNGHGLERAGVVLDARREHVSVELGARVEAAVEPHVLLTLAQAVLKADGMDQVVRDGVMLGVHTIVPLLSARAETDAARLSRAGRLERWQRIAVASAKQCGRAVVPVIRAPLPLPAWLSETTGGLRLLLTEPSVLGGMAGLDALRTLPAPLSATVMAGPEGGWDPTETEAALAAGYLPLTIGRRTLRADAAAQAAIPVLQFLWGDL